MTQVPQTTASPPHNLHLQHRELCNELFSNNRFEFTHYVCYFWPLGAEELHNKLTDTALNDSTNMLADMILFTLRGSLELN